MPINLPITTYTENHLKAVIADDAQINWNDVAGTYDVLVPPGYRVNAVGVQVSQAFDGTTPTLTVGDADSAAGYLTNANIALATAATPTTPAVKRSSGIANAYQFGKYYAAGGVIRFTFAPGAGATVGVAKLFWEMGNPAKAGVPPGTTQTTQL